MNTCSDPQIILDHLERDYVVERIEKRRVHKGEIVYFVKWEDFPNSESTWEKAELLNCHELIDEFETLRESRQRKCSKSVVRQMSRNRDNSRRCWELRRSKRIGRPPARPAYQYSRRDLQILGATTSTTTAGELCYYVKWRHSNDIAMVPARQANREFPNIVLQFLEQRFLSELLQKLAKRAYIQ